MTMAPCAVCARGFVLDPAIKQLVRADSFPRQRRSREDLYCRRTASLLVRYGGARPQVPYYYDPGTWHSAYSTRLLDTPAPMAPSN